MSIYGLETNKIRDHKVKIHQNKKNQKKIEDNDFKQNGQKIQIVHPNVDQNKMKIDFTQNGLGCNKDGMLEHPQNHVLKRKQDPFGNSNIVPTFEIDLSKGNEETYAVPENEIVKLNEKKS